MIPTFRGLKPTAKITCSLRDLIAQPEGQGGFQGLIEKLQNSVDKDTGRIYVSQDDVERIKDYHNKYGGGGFQGRLAQIFGSHIDFNA